MSVRRREASFLIKKCTPSMGSGSVWEGSNKDESLFFSSPYFGKRTPGPTSAPLLFQKAAPTGPAFPPLCRMQNARLPGERRTFFCGTRRSPRHGKRCFPHRAAALSHAGLRTAESSPTGSPLRESVIEISGKARSRRKGRKGFSNVMRRQFPAGNSSRLRASGTAGRHPM